jgi:hypothetical protein
MYQYHYFRITFSRDYCKAGIDCHTDPGSKSLVQSSPQIMILVYLSRMQHAVGPGIKVVSLPNRLLLARSLQIMTNVTSYAPEYLGVTILFHVPVPAGNLVFWSLPSQGCLLIPAP